VREIPSGRCVAVFTSSDVVGLEEGPGAVDVAGAGLVAPAVEPVGVDTCVELSPQAFDVERPVEKFAFNYVPEDVETFFREALICYSHNQFQAFASMCRRTAGVSFVSAPRSESYGRVAVFLDLCGNRWDLLGPR